MGPLPWFSALKATMAWLSGDPAWRHARPPIRRLTPAEERTLFATLGDIGIEPFDPVSRGYQGGQALGGNAGEPERLTGGDVGHLPTWHALAHHSLDGDDGLVKAVSYIDTETREERQIRCRVCVVAASACEAPEKLVTAVTEAELAEMRERKRPRSES